MKIAILGAVFVLGMGLSSCASMGGSDGFARLQAENGDVDMVKVATVNRWAQEHGYTVIWVHMPQKQKTSDGTDP